MQRTIDHFALAYQLVNVSERAIFAFTLALDADRRPVPGIAYVSAAPDDDRVLHVLLGMPPIPDDIDIYAPVVPLAYRLQPREGVRGTIGIDVPVREWHPHSRRAYPETASIVTVNRVVLKIEYVLEGDTFVVDPFDNLDNYFQAPGYPVNAVSAVVELRDPLPVLKRTDDFLRF